MRVLGSRQSDEKTRAAVEIVWLRRSERDRTAVARDEVGCDRKPEPRTAFARGKMKRLEDAGRLLWRESGTVVADLDQSDAVGSDRGEADRRRPLTAGALALQRLSRVAAEVFDDPLHVVGIGEKLEIGWNLDRITDRAAASGFGRLDNLAHDF